MRISLADGAPHAVAPEWRLSATARRLVSVAAFALAVGFLTGHGDLLVLAAGPLVLLVLDGWTRVPERVTVTATAEASRCVEDDPVGLRIAVTADPRPDMVTVLVLGPPSLEIAPVRTEPGAVTTTVTAGRWGVSTMTARISLHSGLRMRRTDLDVDLPALIVLPRPPRLRTTPAQRAVLARLGEHPSRASGSGIEFSGIHEYVPGDDVRDVNWSASSRSRRTLVNERASERAADLVIGVDAFTDIGTAGASTADVAVRGAAALAQAALRHRDRVGLVVFGGVLRWLTPGSDERQFYRVAEAVLSARSLLSSAAEPDVSRLPRPALPPGALVVVFSPLADRRVFAVLDDLRQRRMRTVVVDVQRDGPTPGRRRNQLDPLATRVWRLDRDADQLNLAQRGIRVLTWPAGAELETAFAPVARRVGGPE